MPCRDYESDNYTIREQSRREKVLKKSLDARTKMLCEVMDKLSENAMMAMQFTDEQREWYAKHKEADRREQAWVEYEKDKKKAQRAAIKKFRTFTQGLNDLEKVGLQAWIDEQEISDDKADSMPFDKYYKEGMKTKSWK